jgi:hypothetical protein
LPLHPQTFHLE